jgi:hypothetical protein
MEVAESTETEGTEATGQDQHGGAKTRRLFDGKDATPPRIRVRVCDGRASATGAPFDSVSLRTLPLSRRIAGSVAPVPHRVAVRYVALAEKILKSNSAPSCLRVDLVPCPPSFSVSVPSVTSVSVPSVTSVSVSSVSVVSVLSVISLPPPVAVHRSPVTTVRDPLCPPTARAARLARHRARS